MILKMMKNSTLEDFSVYSDIKIKERFRSDGELAKRMLMLHCAMEYFNIEMLKE